MTIQREERPSIVGQETPSKPYPIYCKTQVISGFGRGSSDLGIPTANIPKSASRQFLDATASYEGETGIYYGWVAVYPSSVSKEQVQQASEDAAVPCDRIVEYNYGSKLVEGEDKAVVFPMVMSVGWNPFYGNKERSAEIHIINKYKHNFYGADIRFLVLGYIRPELDYVSVEALINDINFDIQVALNSLERPEYAKYKNDEFFK